MSKYTPGVLFGEELEALYKDAKENQFALPAVNCNRYQYHQCYAGSCRKS